MRDGPERRGEGPRSKIPSHRDLLTEPFAQPALGSAPLRFAEDSCQAEPNAKQVGTALVRAGSAEPNANFGRLGSSSSS